MRFCFPALAMFDLIRNHKRLMMIILALLIVPGLGLVGVQGLRGMFDESANVASVNGEKIPQQAFDAAMRSQLDRARQSLGDRFDAKMFDTPAARQALLDQMIEQRLLVQEVKRLRLSASDDAVRRAILALPAIQSLRRPDGSLDLDGYRRMLAAYGMTPDQFDAQVRFDLAGQQLPASLEASAIAPQSVATTMLELAGEEREVQALDFRGEDFSNQVSVDDAKLKAYYDANRESLRTPEQAEIDYVVLSAKALAAGEVPSAAQLQKYYDEHASSYRTEAQARASHILISAPKDGGADVRAKARARAEGILAELRAHPERFAELAKQDSQDPGSAEKGGDLGYFGHGMMVKPFDDAAFALKPGQISDLVESDFGYHIIKLTDLKPAVTPPFKDVEDQVRKDFAQQQASERFANDSATFRNLVDAQSDTLKPVADQLKLPLRHAKVSRQPDASLPADDPLNNPKLLAAIFADDVLKDSHNTAPVDVGDNTLVAARVSHYAPAAVPPMAQVVEPVRKAVVAQEAAKLARAAGEARLAQLRQPGQAGVPAGFGTPEKIKRSNPGAVPPVALAEIFKAPPNKLPAYVGVDLPAGGYAIYRVNSVTKAPQPAAAQRDAAASELARSAGAAEFNAYLRRLREDASIKIYHAPDAVASE